MRWKSPLGLGLSVVVLALLAGTAWSSVPSTTEVWLVGAPASNVRVIQDWQFVGCVEIIRKNLVPVTATSPPAFSYPWYVQTSPQDQDGSKYPSGGGANGYAGTPVVGNPPGFAPACAGDPYALFYGEGTWSPAGGTSYNTSVNNRLRGAVVGNAALGTSAAGDSSVARDSLRITVGGGGTSITINNFVGQIRNTLGVLSPLSLRTTMILAVYPDTNAALADVAHSGAGANFFGKVVLTKTQKVDRVELSGGFVAGDFTSTSNAVENTATPKAGLSKTVVVPNAANAVVVLVGQPRVGVADAAPNASPVGLGLISLLLLGGGTWVISRRYGRSLA